MIRAGLALSAFALAACSDREDTGNGVDVGNAASAARSDIDNYAAGTPDAPVLSPKPGGGTPSPRPVPVPTPTGSTPPIVPETPAAPENQQSVAPPSPTPSATSPTGIDTTR